MKIALQSRLRSTLRASVWQLLALIVGAIMITASVRGGVIIGGASVIGGLIVIAAVVSIALEAAAAPVWTLTTSPEQVILERPGAERISLPAAQISRAARIVELRDQMQLHGQSRDPVSQDQRRRSLRPTSLLVLQPKQSSAWRTRSELIELLGDSGLELPIEGFVSDAKLSHALGIAGISYTGNR